MPGEKWVRKRRERGRDRGKHALEKERRTRRKRGEWWTDRENLSEAPELQ